MSVGDQSGLMSSVMLHVEHKMYPYLFVARWGSCFCVMTVIDKSLVIVNLFDFKISCVFPLGVLVLRIKGHCMDIILWDLESVLVLWRT